MPITPKQTKVLQLLARGQTRTEIGLSLECSPKTIDVDIAGIKKRLGARSVAHAVSIGIAKKIISAVRVKS